MQTTTKATTFTNAEADFIDYVERGLTEPATLVFGLNDIGYDAILVAIEHCDYTDTLEWLFSLISDDTSDYYVRAE